MNSKKLQTAKRRGNPIDNKTKSTLDMESIKNMSIHRRMRRFHRIKIHTKRIHNQKQKARLAILTFNSECGASARPSVQKWDRQTWVLGL